MAKKPSEENDLNQPEEREAMPLDETTLDSPVEGEMEPIESGAPEEDIAQEDSLEQTMDDSEAMLGEEVAGVEVGLDDDSQEPGDAHGEELDEAPEEEPGDERDKESDEETGIEPDEVLVEVLDEDLDEALDEEHSGEGDEKAEETGIEPDEVLVEVLDEDLDEALDEEPDAESEPTIEVEPSPYFPRGIYEDAWSVEAYYGRERPSDMDQSQDNRRRKLTAHGKKRLGILLVALALVLVLGLIFLTVTGRIYLPF